MSQPIYQRCIKCGKLYVKVVDEGLCGDCSLSHPRSAIESIMDFICDTKRPSDVHGILVAYLEANGYDGLVNPDLGCGCVLGKLRPCESSCIDCSPAYICSRQCSTCPEKECEMRGEDGGWMMFLQKQKGGQK